MTAVLYIILSSLCAAVFSAVVVTLFCCLSLLFGVETDVEVEYVYAMMIRILS